MTREEALAKVRGYLTDYLSKEDAWEIEEIMKALEQEPILDKIRAEIKVLSPEPTAYDVVDGNSVKDAIWETLIEVDKIIDKYKTESEEEE